jgi:hypothetical protein
MQSDGQYRRKTSRGRVRCAQASLLAEYAR